MRSAVKITTARALQDCQSFFMSKPKHPTALIDDEAGEVSRRRHVAELEQRPTPTAGLTPNYRHGADALQSQDVKD